jgi:exodeoxyribonuclease VII small subunit
VSKAKPAASTRSAESLGFEGALERLEDLVQRLEGGELPLESALEAFEEGVSLTRQCADRLAAAERRVETLAREGSRLVERPLDPEDAPDEDE